MGNAKKLRKNYNTPSHPWQKERIVEEKELKKEYGLKNKKEIWKHSSMLSNFKNIAKKAISSSKDQDTKEGEQLLARLRSLGLLSESAMLNDILTLNDKDIIERRLQTVIVRKGLARSVKQARQFITHGHIKVNGVKISAPSYLVKKAEEEKLEFNAKSTLADADHPERNIEIAKELGKGKKEEVAPEQTPAAEKLPDSEEKSAEVAAE